MKIDEKDTETPGKKRKLLDSKKVTTSTMKRKVKARIDCKSDRDGLRQTGIWRFLKKEKNLTLGKQKLAKVVSKSLIQLFQQQQKL